jgi:hypothetical protein
LTKHPKHDQPHFSKTVKIDAKKAKKRKKINPFPSETNTIKHPQGTQSHPQGNQQKNHHPYNKNQNQQMPTNLASHAQIRTSGKPTMNHQA